MLLPPSCTGFCARVMARPLGTYSGARLQGHPALHASYIQKPPERFRSGRAISVPGSSMRVSGCSTPLTTLVISLVPSHRSPSWHGLDSHFSVN